MKRTEEMQLSASNFRFGQMKRKYHRAIISDFIGDLADGNTVFGGTIRDISLGGFRIGDIPESFVADKQLYTAILSSKGKHYRLLVTPCWKKKGTKNDMLDIGFKILDAPWEWVELTMNHLPEFALEDTHGFQA